MSRTRKTNRDRVFVGVAIALTTCCYVLVDAVATEQVAAYERFEAMRLALFWGLPVAMAFALGYWIASANADTNAQRETRVIAVVATVSVVSGHLLAYAVGIPAGIVPSLSVSTAVVRTVVTTVFVALGATAGSQLARLTTGAATVDWRLPAVASSALLLAGLLEFVSYQQTSPGIFFIILGGYWAVVTVVSRQ
jgi:putative Mn2+ efflux pump MntP